MSLVGRPAQDVQACIHHKSCGLSHVIADPAEHLSRSFVHASVPGQPPAILGPALVERVAEGVTPKWVKLHVFKLTGKVNVVSRN